MPLSTEDRYFINNWIAKNANLKGSIFKRKSLDPHRVKSLGWFALSGALWTYSPWLVAHFGSNLSTLAISSAAVGGMWNFSESNVINSIKVSSSG